MILTPSVLATSRAWERSSSAPRSSFRFSENDTPPSDDPASLIPPSGVPLNTHRERSEEVMESDECLTAENDESVKSDESIEELSIAALSNET